MSFHQTPEDIIKNATAEQRILWNDIFLRYGEKIGIRQLSYIGVILGSEFLTYSVNKMYFALDFVVSGIPTAASATVGYVFFYNEANALTFTFSNNSAVWDATAAVLKQSANSGVLHNILFSRIVSQAHLQISFIGYRLSI